jgi:multidrug efflux system membrane fusion protein
MRVFSILTAALVITALYLAVFERERVLEFARSASVTDPIPATAEPETAADGMDAAQVAEGTPAETTGAEDAGVSKDERRVSVVAIRSEAREVATAVVLRGRTEAARQVDVRAETSGLVTSEPLPKGTRVETGQVLCRIDPGTRELTLAEAQARLAEAEARVPEAQARVPEAQARLEEAQARVKEAEARLQEAEINQRAASRLGQGGFASEIRVAEAEAALEAARAGVQNARSGLETARAAIETAKSGIETARANVQSAKAAVATAETDLGRLVLTAPFAGLLESETAELGSLLQPGGLCATVIRLDPIHLVGFVPETEVSRIHPGAPARARLASGAEVEGHVSFLSRTADEATRTFRVEVIVENENGELSDGQTAEIVITSDGAEAHFLPQSSLTLNDEGELGVRTVEDGARVGFSHVTVLRDTTEGVWVSGLPPKADVIVLGQEYVTQGGLIAPSYNDTFAPLRDMGG